MLQNSFHAFPFQVPHWNDDRIKKQTKKKTHQLWEQIKLLTNVDGKDAKREDVCAKGHFGKLGFFCLSVGKTAEVSCLCCCNVGSMNRYKVFCLSGVLMHIFEDVRGTVYIVNISGLLRNTHVINFNSRQLNSLQITVWPVGTLNTQMTSFQTIQIKKKTQADLWRKHACRRSSSPFFTFFRGS